MTPHDYYLSVIGKRFDEDGRYGCQCVDGFKHFCRTVLGFNISLGAICNPTGYATSIWDNYESLGLNKYFDKVAPNQMVDGDWAIWSMNSRSCPYSHVAMFRKDNGNGTGIFLGQNQLNHPEYTQVNIFYDGLRGGLRPKIYHQNKTEYINIPPSIEARNIYNINTKKQFTTIKPKKFGGLSYKILSYQEGKTYAEIETHDYGKVLVKITAMTPITNTPQYSHGNY